MFKTGSLAGLRMVVTCALATIVFCGCGQTEPSMKVIPGPATIDNGVSSTQESSSVAASGKGPDAGSNALKAEPTDKQLNVGDLAPPLKIGQWVLGDAVDPLPSGRVRVVEFWATSSTPCLVTMPYLSQLQEKYSDSVEIVGITQEPVENVQDYMDSYQAPGVTRRQMLKYRLAIDAERATSAAYMDAAGQGYIPTAFIVGKDGIIEWIGHASRVDDPLAKVVAGEWDREAAFAEFKRDREFLDFRVGEREVGDDPTKFEFRRELVTEARQWNLDRFKQAVDAGVKTIVVDRGNGLNSESQAYAQYAHERGYRVELREPESEWWQEIRVLLKYKSTTRDILYRWADKLAAKNRETHSTPASLIRHWMDCWRHDVTVQDILTFDFTEPTRKKKRKASGARNADAVFASLAD